METTFNSYFKQKIEKTTNMPYDEFMKLDAGEQRHLIEQANGRKTKIDDRPRMDCVPISSKTLEEKMHGMDNSIFSNPKKLVKRVTNKIYKR